MACLFGENEVEAAGSHENERIRKLLDTTVVPGIGILIAVVLITAARSFHART